MGQVFVIPYYRFTGHHMCALTCSSLCIEKLLPTRTRVGTCVHDFPTARVKIKSRRRSGLKSPSFVGKNRRWLFLLRMCLRVRPVLCCSILPLCTIPVGALGVVSRGIFCACNCGELPGITTRSGPGRLSPYALKKPTCRTLSADSVLHRIMLVQRLQLE